MPVVPAVLVNSVSGGSVQGEPVPGGSVLGGSMHELQQPNQTEKLWKSKMHHSLEHTAAHKKGICISIYLYIYTHSTVLNKLVVNI